MSLDITTWLSKRYVTLNLNKGNTIAERLSVQQDIRILLRTPDLIEADVFVGLVIVYKSRIGEKSAMFSKNNPSSYDCYKNAEPDEPMFVLLARDEKAPGVVVEWVLRRAFSAVPGVVPADAKKALENAGKLDAKASEALDCAAAMEAWKANHSGRILVPPTPQEPKLDIALKEKFRAILEKPLTPRSLLEFEKTARSARELLAVGMDPQAVRNAYYGLSPVASILPYEGSMVNPIPLQSSSNELVPDAPIMSTRSENFGAQIVRELLGMLGNLGKKEPPPKSSFELITAISLAREKGMDDLAKKLEAELLDSLQADRSTAPAIVVPPPATDEEAVASFREVPKAEPKYAPGFDKFGPVYPPLPAFDRSATTKSADIVEAKVKSAEQPPDVSNTHESSCMCENVCAQEKAKWPFKTGQRVYLEFPMSPYHGMLGSVESPDATGATVLLDNGVRHSGPTSNFRPVSPEEYRWKS